MQENPVLLGDGNNRSGIGSDDGSNVIRSNVSARLEQRKRNRISGVADRIDVQLGTDTLARLERMADRQRVSVDYLVSHVLESHAARDRYELARAMPVPGIFSALLQVSLRSAGSKDVSGTTAATSSRLVRDTATIAFSFMKKDAVPLLKRYDMWTMLDVLEQYLRVAGLDAVHRVRGSDGGSNGGSGGNACKHYFTVYHHDGSVPSLFAEELLTLVFEKVTDATVIIMSSRGNFTQAELQPY